ncbi:MAG: hypothetical protein ACKOW2_01510 [Sphingobacteriaceae bacterium]
MLSNLPMKDYKKALKVIPKVLKISPNTFFNYRNIKANEERDVPYQKMLQLEQIFGVKPGGLQNAPVKCKHINELLEEYKSPER